MGNPEPLNLEEIEPPTLAEIERELVDRGGLAEFIRLAWPVLEPKEPLRWNWAMDAITQHLEAVTGGQIKKLLINVPPGFSKSLQTCVFWPAWEWGPKKQPELRIIGSSYSEDYATRDSRRMRDLVSSRWYRERWGDQVYLVKEGEKSFENSRRGWRKGLPYRRLTGGRGHRVIIDDPHSTESAESEADRKRAVRIFRESLPTRLVDPKESAIVVIMQRLHDGDVSGEILKHDLGYEHLMIPMRQELEHPHRSVSAIGWEDPRKVEGELAFPERFSLEVTDGLERDMGSYATAGQHQQRPSPRGGNLVKFVWLRNRFRQPTENPIRVIQSWDTAGKAKQRNAPAACGTFAEFKDHVELWHVRVERLEFPELLLAIRDLAARFGPSEILIEDKSSGEAAIQQLRRDTDLPITAFDPGTLDKETRMMVETPYVENGNLWLPVDAPWVDAYIEEFTTFPASKFKDQTDMTSQFLRWRRENPLLLSPARPRIVRKRSNRF